MKEIRDFTKDLYKVYEVLQAKNKITVKMNTNLKIALKYSAQNLLQFFSENTKIFFVITKFNFLSKHFLIKNLFVQKADDFPIKVLYVL